MRFLYSVAPDARPVPRSPTATSMTIDILLTQPLRDTIDAERSARYAVHRLHATDQPDALLERVAPRRASAASSPVTRTGCPPR